MSRLRLGLFLSLITALVVGGIWKLWPEDDSDRVRAAVEQVLDGARRADLGAIMGPVSADYHDPDGLNKEAIRGLLFREFAKRGPIGIHTGPIDVTVDGDRATARFDAVLVEGVAGSPIPVDADALSVTVDLAREEGGWAITGHRREPLEEGWKGRER